jgi:hypothetical protein
VSHHYLCLKCRVRSQPHQNATTTTTTANKSTSILNFRMQSTGMVSLQLVLLYTQVSAFQLQFYLAYCNCIAWSQSKLYVPHQNLVTATPTLSNHFYLEYLHSENGHDDGSIRYNGCPSFSSIRLLEKLLPSPLRNLHRAPLKILPSFPALF